MEYKGIFIPYKRLVVISLTHSFIQLIFIE